jgi:DNA-dependent RNA polymerase auxiliary subunit epsilon
MEKIQVKAGNSYIFKEKYVSTVNKGKVLELTKTTYYIQWENGNKIRYLIEDFHYKYEPIEEFEDNIAQKLDYANKI